VFTARYALSPYIKQIGFAFRGLTNVKVLFYATFFHMHNSTAFWKVPRLCPFVLVRAYVYENGNDTDKETLKSSEKKNLAQCHFVHHKSYILAWDRTRASLVRGHRLAG
jgi:hypothetical protein